MVGKKIAVFTAEEIKATGKLSKDQKRFKKIIKRMGGIVRVINKDY
jgi:ribosomal protein L13